MSGDRGRQAPPVPPRPVRTMRTVSWVHEASDSVLAAFGDAFGEGVAVAMAAVDNDATELCCNAAARADGRFEIGSITKTMTAALVVLAASEGRVSFDDEIGTWLDAGANG